MSDEEVNQSIAELEAELKEARKELRTSNRQIEHLKQELSSERFVTAQRLNEKSIFSHLQKERDRYLSLVLANTSTVMLFLDNNRRVVFCTDFFLKAAGFTEFHEVNGRYYLEVLNTIFSKDTLGQLEDHANRAQETLQAQNLILHTKHQDGRQIELFDATITPLHGNENDSLDYLIIMNNITVIEEARRHAEAASQAKGNFLSNMSHEIRTPLNAIVGMITIGKRANTTERKDYALSRIESASHHLLGVINDILDMSKIESGKMELSIEEFNFERMALRVVNVINFKVEEKRQNLQVFLDPSIPPTLYGDDQRLAQVITNLLGNANKFTPEGGYLTLSASLESLTPDNAQIKISVVDSGIGIAKEAQKKLFGSFNQADSSISRKFGGTGLGLAISKSIVELMNGRIWIESEPGRGSAFCFIINLRPGTSADTVQKLRSGSNWNNLRVLAIDDSKQTRDYFLDIGSAYNLHVEVAESGQEALDLIAQNGDYDIYFVDFLMPGMDGIQLTEHIKQGAHQPHVVIMLTAADWAEIEGQAALAGVDRHVQKPLFPSSLVDVINECLGANTVIEQEAELDDNVEEHDYSRYTILLAEDVDVNREIVQALLEPTNLTIECAENGKRALEMFQENQNRYDAIFMDVQMPEMDGLVATRAIRGLNTASSMAIPIIAMTANVFKEDIEQCIEAGMDSHVGKPIHLPDVLAVLDEYLPILQRAKA